MSTTEIMQRSEKASLRLRTKFVGAYYLLTGLTCAVILFFHGGSAAFIVRSAVAIVYVAITALFYGVSKPEKKQKGD